MAGPQSDFPTTHWGVILSIKSRDSAARREQLDRLLRTYWEPIFQFIRHTTRKGDADARDLTQALVTTLLERDFTADLDPQMGRFRYYLKSSIQNFLRDEWRREKTLKRGGAATVLHLDESPMNVSSGGRTPEEAFDEAWRQTVLSESIRVLKERLLQAGKEVYVRVFERYAQSPGLPPTYEEIAKDLGLSVYDVCNYLTFTRGLLKKVAQEKIAQYSDQVDEELRDLFA